jgi:hypothetical protein
MTVPEPAFEPVVTLGETMRQISDGPELTDTFFIIGSISREVSALGTFLIKRN